MNNNVFEEQTNGNIEDRLRQLNDLYDKRLITTEEYEQKKKDLLSEL